MAEKVRNNIDYSASAVNLTNHESFNGMFEDLRHWQENKTKLEDELKVKNVKLYELLAGCDKEINIITNDIKLSIEQYGSYQDLEQGRYAVKQRVVSVSYLPDAVHEVLPPSLIAAVIVESVDKATVEALVKAGRITVEQQKQISSEAVHFRYIIK